MKTYKYKTLSGLMKASKGNQFTLNELIEGRFYHTGKRFKVTEELQRDLLQMYAKAIWERQWKTKFNKLGMLKPCGILQRVYIAKHNNEFRSHYCAGQDYPSEIRFIQKMVNNV